MLTVVTHRSWLADSLRAGAQAVGVPFAHEYGLWVPRSDAWWAPTEWVARAMRSGGHFDLQAPGASLLPQLRPDVRTMTVGQLAHDGHGKVFAKMAEAKSDAFPAQVWPDQQDAVCAAHDAGIGDDTVLHVTDRTIRFTVEVRCFMVFAQPTTASTYLVDGQTEGWTDDVWAGPATLFARDVAHGLDSMPAGWVLDVGLSDDGWEVIEANPAWSSNPYDADPAGVVRCVVAACDTGPWTWQPDPWLMTRAARQTPLPLRTDDATSNH